VSILSKTFVAVGALGLATAFTIPAAQAEQGDWLIRGGATLVSPKSNNLKLDAGDLGVLTLNVKDATSFGFNVAYMMTDNFGIELLAAVPFKHNVDASVSGVSGSVRLGSVKQLPPTLSLQYYFMPDGKFSPYVGLGMNWTSFSSEKLSSDFQDALAGEGITDACFSLKDSFGVAVQLGADFHFSDNWFLNGDIRWINIETKGTITGTDIEGPFSEPMGTLKIDPIVYSIMIGYKF
jgi:outer membrane protein